MRCHARHVTTYDYAEPVQLSHNLMHLTVRGTATQKPASTMLRVSPEPDEMYSFVDAFGNTVHTVVIQQAHRRMTVEAVATVDLTPSGDASAPQASGAWESVRDIVQRTPNAETLDALQYCFASRYVPRGEDIAAWAAPAFPVGRPVLEGAFDLTRRIHETFEYDPRATNISTPVAQVMEHRRGVCQDFAHVALGCLRSIGLPARYVSGYLRTDPRPGAPRLEGVDASHAWISVFAPGIGWIDFDPTNGCLCGDRHVTVAWGLDFHDVSPVKGVVLGGGPSVLSVGVDVTLGDPASVS